MIHLPALPGSPSHHLPMGEIIERAISDAQILRSAGFRAVMIENYGDIPFTPDEIDPATASALAIVAAAVKADGNLLVGVNALRNDARSALGVAAASGADFIRVNVHIGAAVTDQGILEGKADRTLRYRKLLGGGMAIFADVHVKHASPLGESDIARAAEETAYRGMADGLIVSGTGTGQPADLEHLQRVREAVPDRPLLVGSGASKDTIAGILDVADGAIVGTSIKTDGRTAAPVDPHRADAFMRAVDG